MEVHFLNVIPLHKKGHSHGHFHDVVLSIYIFIRYFDCLEPPWQKTLWALHVIYRVLSQQKSEKYA